MTWLLDGGVLLAYFIAVIGIGLCQRMTFLLHCVNPEVPELT
jgi:hypothetical protein